MPVPQISDICKFGNLPIPGTGATQAWIDLNDHTSWFLQAISSDQDNRLVQTQPLLFRGRGAWLSDDFVASTSLPTGSSAGKVVHLPFYYLEQVQPLTAALAPLFMAGEQQLTFDNATYTPAILASAGIPTMATLVAPLLWKGQLEFLCRDPWSYDMASTTPAATNVSGNGPTTFSIAYTGTVWCEPTFTVTIPATNTAVITSMTLANTTSNETLTADFGSGLAASTAITITVDCRNWHILGPNSTEYDIGAASFGDTAFPMLYPGTNAFSIQLTTSSGTASGVTVAPSYQNRYQL